MKLITLFASIFLLSSFTLSQSKVEFDFDYARFNYDYDKSYVEIYYSIQQNTLTKIGQNGKSLVSGVLNINLINTQNDSVIVNRDWEIKSVLSDSLMKSNSLIGVLGFILKEGNYQLSMKLTDAADTNKSKSITEIINVNKFQQDQMSISDIQIASSIKQDNIDTTSIFYKNTLEVIPNPMMVFGEGSPVLYYYVEIYNIQNDETSPIKLKTSLYNSQNRIVYERDRNLSRTVSSRVEVGTVNLTKFPTSSYTLVLSLVDSSNNVGVSSAKRLYIYNPSVKDTMTNLYAKTDIYESEYNLLEEEEVEDLYNKSKYIASNMEKERFENLNDLNAKRKFLYNFWSKRDPNLNTERNEFKDEYMKRIDESNEKYGSFNRKGMETDRGRVYITYGEPDEIDRYPSSGDSKPYEVWYYNQIEGGVVFVFGDLTGFSSYELLHSTKRGELRDDNWMRRIQQN